MTIVTSMVLYAVVWTVVFFLVNPLWQVSQAESGHVEPGTPASAPVDAMIRRKAIITTVVSLVVLGIVWVVLDRHLVTLEDFGWATPPATY